MRIAIVLASFLPFLYYAAKDNAFHFRGRQVSLSEHLLHLAIGLTLMVVLTHAVLGNTSIMMVGLLLFLAAGALDEYIWHRDIPGVESDLHAKEHLALMIFVVVTLVVNWLEGHQWQLPAEMLDLMGMQSQRTDRPIVADSHELAGPWWRAIAFPVFLVPYAYFGFNDNLHHFRHRHVCGTERILHLTIVLSLLIVVPHAMVGTSWIVLTALVMFLLARSADEWLFHRGLPSEEVDRHAKTHFAFLGFLVLMMTVDWFSS